MLNPDLHMQHSNTKRQKIRKRLIVTILSLVMAGTLSFGLSGLNSAQDSAKKFGTSSSEAMDLIELKGLIAHQREQMLQMLLTDKLSEQKDLELQIHKRSYQIDNILDTFEEIASEESDLGQQLKELKHIRALSKRTRDEQVLPLIRNGRRDEARKLLLGVQQQRFNEMREISKSIAVKAQDKAFVESAQIGQKSNKAFQMFVITSLLSMAAGICLVLFLSHSRQ